MREGPLLGAFLAAVALAASPVAGALAHPGDNPLDGDHDGVNDYDDNCPENYNPDQRNSDGGAPGGDARGDSCDDDDDADGLIDEADNCRQVANRGQEDLDEDGGGDPCDPDDDFDGVPDGSDNCARVANRDQADADRDGSGDRCDPTPGTAGGRTDGLPAGGGPAPEPEPGGTSDGNPPRVAISLRRRHSLADVLAGGLTVPVSCSEGCSIEARLSVDSRTARRLRMSRRGPALIGTGAWSVARKARTFVFVELTRVARSRLRRARSVRATLETKVADAAGNSRSIERRITLIQAADRG